MTTGPACNADAARGSGAAVGMAAAFLVWACLGGAAVAAGPTPDFAMADSAPTAPPQWNVACSSEARSAPLNCAVEQVAIVAETRQRFGAISVHTAADAPGPTLQVLTPLGLFIPAGVSIKPDNGKPVALQVQSCDPSGCHAEMPVTADFLKALQTGKRLTLSLQNLSRKTMSVDFSLDGFSTAFAKIK